MQLKSLLGFMLACILVFAGLATIGSSGSDCNDNSYALSHPEVCGAAVEGCGDNDYALTHPLECGSPVAGCDDNNYALTHPLECGQQPVGCDDNNYALSHPLECGVSAGCEDNTYALTHPLECSKAAVGCDDNNYALTHPLECGKKVGCEDNDYALTHPLDCGKQVPQVCTPGSRRWGSLPETLSPSLCRSDWTAITDCNQYGQWVFVDCVSPYEDTCTPPQQTSCSVLGCGKTDSCGSFCGSCPVPAVVDNAPTTTINVPASAAPSSQLSIQVTGNDDKDVAQLLLYDASNNLLETLNCDGIQTSCSKTFTRTAPSAFSASYTFKARSKDSAGQFSSAFVSGTGTTTAAPGLADNPPAAAINVPASAVPSSNIAIVVSGTDDNDVAQLLLYDSGNVQIGAPFDCVGVQASCSNTFTVAAPSAFSTAYTFKARSKDSANQLSGFVSGSGTTTAAPVVPSVIPPVVPPVTPPPVTPPITPPAVEVAEMPKPLQVISIKFPLQPLFLRALNFPDSDCVRPGESALLAVKVQNTAKAALKDLKFTATVPELGVRVSGGPAKLKANGKLTQLLRLDIPEDAEESTYYLRFSISNNKFSRAVHRTFIVDSSC